MNRLAFALALIAAAYAGALVGWRTGLLANEIGRRLA